MGCSTVRACARGAVGAMAMTGMRRVTMALGLVRETPPESMIEETAHGLLAKVPPKRRPVLVEAAHIGWGAAGGVMFGLLPGGLRRARAVGPLYGAASWLVFDRGLAPALGLPQATDPSTVERLALLADHVLYGLVVAGAARQ